MPGLLEILIILGLVIVLFGYSRIPMLGKSLGRGVCEFGKSFRKAADLVNLPGCTDTQEKKAADERRGQS